MSFCTMGMYELFWMYKNWVLIKDREKTEIMPVLRTIFSVFFIFSLFCKIREKANSENIKNDLKAGLLAISWIIVMYLYKMPDPYWILSTFTFLFIIPVQMLAIRINDTLTPGHDKDEKFSPWNIAAIIILGSLVTFLMINTILYPEPYGISPLSN